LLTGKLHTCLLLLLLLVLQSICAGLCMFLRGWLVELLH
jgi:hypothetical protein